jgi:hypothetical protein
VDLNFKAAVEVVDEAARNRDEEFQYLADL